MDTKIAKWADVKAKAEAIVATDGVELIREDSNEIEAYVMSIQVADDFPVSEGGIYHVILSKRTWENQKNVGGWVQGYLCDCAWGEYHSGEPGPGWQGRFCSHAMATLIVSNARARREFMDDRTASIDLSEFVSSRDDFGFEWGIYRLSDGRYAASFTGEQMRYVKAPMPTYDMDRLIEHMQDAIIASYEPQLDWEPIDTELIDDAVMITIGGNRMLYSKSAYRLEPYSDEYWSFDFSLYQCDESEPWFGMSYDDAMQNGFDFGKYDYRYDSFYLLEDDAISDYGLDPADDFDESIIVWYIMGMISHGGRGWEFRGHTPTTSDIIEIQGKYYYMEYDTGTSVEIDIMKKGIEVAAHRKTAGAWEWFNENITPELKYDMLDVDEIIDIYGAYVDESYRIVNDDGLLGVVSHHVGGHDDWWSWDTYAGYYSYGIDCGMCDSKEEAMANVERSFADPGFTVTNKTARAIELTIDDMVLQDGNTYVKELEDEAGCILRLVLYYDEVMDDWYWVLYDPYGDVIADTDDIVYETSALALDDFCDWCDFNIEGCSKQAEYILEDSRGFPQCEPEVHRFDEWWELDEYLDNNPDVARRLEEGYAVIHEGGKTAGYPYASYNEDSKWYCTVDEFEGEYDLEALKALYESHVDKDEYKEFDDWEWDATRSGWLHRIDAKKEASDSPEVANPFTPYLFDRDINVGDIIDVYTDPWPANDYKHLWIATYEVLDKNTGGMSWRDSDGYRNESSPRFTLRNVDTGEIIEDKSFFMVTVFRHDDVIEYSSRVSKKASCNSGYERNIAKDASKTSDDFYTVDIEGTDMSLEARWNSVTVVFPDGSREVIDYAYADSEYNLTGRIMSLLDFSDDEEKDEVGEAVWNAVNECFEWESEAYFLWENDIYASKKQAGSSFPDYTEEELRQFAQEELLNKLKQDYERELELERDPLEDDDDWYREEGEYVYRSGKKIPAITKKTADNTDDIFTWLFCAYDNPDWRYDVTIGPGIFTIWLPEYGDVSFALPIGSHLETQCRAIEDELAKYGIIPVMNGWYEREPYCQWRRFSKGASNKFASIGYDMDGNEVRIGDAVYNDSMDAWYKVVDVDDFGIIELHEITGTEADAVRFVDKDELASEYMLNPEGLTEYIGKFALYQDASKKNAYERNPAKDVWMSDDEFYAMESAWCNYSDGMYGYANAKGYWELRLDGRNGVILGHGNSTSMSDAMHECDMHHDGLRGACRNASKKNATRKFTYAEMQELEDEVEDKPWLNNADRLKDPDMLMSF